MNETGSLVSIVRVSIAAVLLAIVLVFVVDLLAGPFFSFSTKTWPPEIRGGKLIGGIQGPVKAADVDAGVVSIASGFLGLASLPLVVTPETQGLVGAKQFELMKPGAIFVNTARAMLHDTDALVAALDSAEESAPKPDAAPSTVTSAPPVVPAPVSPTPTPVPGSAPNRNSTVTTPAAKRTVVAPSSSPRTPETPRAPAPRPAVAPTSPPAEDGGAAIDWLIKGSSARNQ